MKKIIILVSFLALCIGTQAQQKIGYINSLDLLKAMPAVKKADQQVQTYTKTFQTQLETMNKEYEQKVKAYQATEKTLSDAIKEIKVKEIQDLQNRIVTLQQSAEKKVSKKREDLYAPILEKADKAIKAVGKEKGYTYILDSSTGSMLYAEEKDDIMAAVKAKLGIK